MQMEINELYHKFRKEGRGVGHAQWCVGLRCLHGNEVKRDLDKAEEWFLKAWDNKFPGTANTQAFVLKRRWERFISAAFQETPRVKALLIGANTLSNEQHGIIIIPTHNDAQKEWLNDRIEEMVAAFRQFTNDCFISISIFTVVW